MLFMYCWLIFLLYVAWREIYLIIFHGSIYKRLQQKNTGVNYLSCCELVANLFVICCTTNAGNICSYLQALIGTTVRVPTLSGHPVTLEMKSVIKPTTIRRIQGEGLPLPKNPSQKGDLIVEFDIKFPDHLSDSAKQILAQTLPQTNWDW